MSLFAPLAPGDPRRHAPSTERNAEPLLAVLRSVFPASGTVLEVAAGTGQHAVHFARALPGLAWLPSDPDPDMRSSIAAWTAAEGPGNLRPPLDLDVADPLAPWPPVFDAALCVNMAHISPWAATLGLLAGAARALPIGGPLAIYGPFMRGGRHTSDSNAAFDSDLKRRNPAWGLRDVGDIAAAADPFGLALDKICEMPANNLTLIFRRQFDPVH